MSGDNNNFHSSFSLSSGTFQHEWDPMEVPMEIDMVMHQNQDATAMETSDGSNAFSKNGVMNTAFNNGTNASTQTQAQFYQLCLNNGPAAFTNYAIEASQNTSNNNLFTGFGDMTHNTKAPQNTLNNNQYSEFSDMMTDSMPPPQDVSAIDGLHDDQIQLRPHLQDGMIHTGDIFQKMMNDSAESIQQDSDPVFDTDTLSVAIADPRLLDSFNSPTRMNANPTTSHRSTNCSGKKPPLPKTRASRKPSHSPGNGTTASGSAVPSIRVDKTTCINCDVCGKKFGDEDALERHKARSHKQTNGAKKEVRCDNCGRMCANSANLRRHINNAHSGIQDKHCKFCPATFSSERSLSLHMGTEHHDISEKEGGPKRARKRPCQDVFVCPLCSYNSHQKYNITRHFKIVHSHETEYQCPEPGCGRICKSKANYKTHLMTCRRKSGFR